MENITKESDENINKNEEEIIIKEIVKEPSEEEKEELMVALDGPIRIARTALFRHRISCRRPWRLSPPLPLSCRRRSSPPSREAARPLP